MNSVFRATLASLSLASSPILHAGITYVDATTGAGGNTTLANGSVFTPPLNGTTGADNNWEQRTPFGSGGNIYEAGGENPAENAPEIKTTISGLTPGASYNVHAFFWDPDSTSEDWNLRAGSVSNAGANALYAAADATADLGGATAAVPATSLTYSTAPTIFAEGGRSLLAALVGNFTADGSGQISVFLDDMPAATTVNRRTWFDGVGYESAAAPNSVTYVDANTGNTIRRDGLPFNPAPDGTTGLDNNWETRNLGNNGGVFESNAEATEDAPMLVTTLTGLQPNTDYVLYACFWDAATGNWRIKASAAPGDINNNGTTGDLTDDYLPASPLTNFAADNNAGGTATVAPLAAGTSFVATPLTTEADRNLRMASLGTATSDGSGNLSIYIDDLAFVAQDRRTWYDGIGYKLALPLVPAADEDGDGLTNGDESTHGTNPYIADTDGDTYNDAVEIAAGSDPLDAQSVPPLPGNSLEIAPDGAWTWFNDERAIFHQGSLFCGYVKGNGQYGVTRYDPATNETFHMIISTGTSQQQDDHNNPSITVLPDGRLMVLYARHLGGSQFYQRTSLVALPSSNADWGPEIIQPLTDNNTYNNTYILSAESNRIYNFHRNINFNPTITWSDDLGANWTSTQFVDVGTGNVRPYPRYCSNHIDRVDLIYTDGHPRDVDNSVYHMYYKGGNFHRTDGSTIDSFANLPLEHENGPSQRGSVIYQFSAAAWGTGQGPDDWIPGARGWTWDVHYGKDGNPVCVFQTQIGTDGTWSTSRIYYYYARWTGTGWQKRFIAKAGRGIYAAESDYGGGMTIDPENPNVIYISTNAANPFDLALDPGNLTNIPLNTNARFEIYRGITSDGGLNFTWTPVTTNSEADNLRPIVPENHGYDNALIWFNGTYNSYTSFATRVLAIFKNDLKLKTSSFSPASNSGNISWASSPGYHYRITGSSDLTDFPHVAASGIASQGATTSRTFGFPLELQNSPKAFFRVEQE